MVRQITAKDSEAIADGVIDHDEIEKFIEGGPSRRRAGEHRWVADRLAAAGWKLDPSLVAADARPTRIRPGFSESWFFRAFGAPIPREK